MSDFIGEYRCDVCGVFPISDPTRLTIYYPSGALDPIVKLTCEQCGKEIITVVDWEDAELFDASGANVVGYSIVRGPDLSEEEIKKFLRNFDVEMEEFLEASEQG